MSLAAVTAKIGGRVLHLFRADGGLFCGSRETARTLATWRPEEATCKKCLTNYREKFKRFGISL